MPLKNKNTIRIVPHLDSAHSLVFNIIERDLFTNDKAVLKIGRFIDRFFDMNRITFKSKVVSRGHAEIWVKNDQV
jgi:pSer/pThr/pTyr-binding forkhead associated (FHA) protein